MSLRVESDRECCANCAYNDDLQCSKWKGHAPLRASKLGEKPAWCPGWVSCIQPAINRYIKASIHKRAHYHCGPFGDDSKRLKPFCWKEAGHDGAHCTCNGAKICGGCRGLWAERDMYAELDRVLAMARAQAADGKGKKRHARPGQPFEEQGIVADCVTLGSAQGALFQIIKKAKESERLPTDRAIVELLGVINYAAAAILVREHLSPAPEENKE